MCITPARQGGWYRYPLTNLQVPVQQRVCMASLSRPLLLSLSGWLGTSGLETSHHRGHSRKKNETKRQKKRSMEQRSGASAGPRVERGEVSGGDGGSERHLTGREEPGVWFPSSISSRFARFLPAPVLSMVYPMHPFTSCRPALIDGETRRDETKPDGQRGTWGRATAR